MSENWWDPKEHSSGSFLDGKRGVIREATFERNNCRGNCDERTVLKFRLVLPDVADDKQPYPSEVSLGKKIWPSLDGETKEVSGPKLAMGGNRVDVKCYFHAFQVALASAGFPLKRFSEMGAEALNGADVTFRGIQKTFKIKGELVEPTWDIISEFHGFVDEGEAGWEAGVGESELVPVLAGALKQALNDAGGSIPRGQVSIRLSKALGDDNPQRTEILALATDDDVLGQIEGITFDKKVISLVQEV